MSYELVFIFGSTAGTSLTEYAKHADELTAIRFSLPILRIEFHEV